MKSKILLSACVIFTLISSAQNPLLLRQATSGGTATVSQVVSTVSGYTFYNTVDNSNHFTNAWGLWRTNGTVEGTQKLSLNDGRFVDTEATLLTTLGNNKILFAGDNEQGHGEVWVSDGTKAGTLALESFNPGTGFSAVIGIVALGNADVYAVYSNNKHLQLRKTTGATGDTALIYDFGLGMNAPFAIKTIGSLVYFALNNPTTLHTEIWQTDGTNAGTFLLKDLGLNYGLASDFMPLGSNFYFVTISSTFGDYIWKSDGTRAGTAQLKQISTAFNQDNLYPFYAATSAVLYFTANDGTNGKELWKTDGTANGTNMVTDLFPGSTGSNPSSFAVLNDNLYLSANNGITGQELFKYDSNSSSITLVKDIFSGGTGSYPSNLTVQSNTILFSATRSTDAGTELWVTDGSTVNTLQIADINPATGLSSNPKLISVTDTSAYFAASVDVNGDGIVDQGVFKYSVPDKIWTGNVSGDVSVAGNWFPAGAPSQSSTDNIIISATAGNNITNPFLFVHDFYNNSATVDVGTGLCLISGDFFNAGTINNTAVNGSYNGVFGLVTSGGPTTHLVGSTGIYNGQLTVSGGSNIKLTANSYFPALRIEGGDLAYLGNYNLQSDGFSLGGPNLKVVTDGTGKFFQPVGGSSVVFNVSTDSASSSQVQILNIGDYDYFGVNVKNGVFSKGTYGDTITQEAVNKTWDISEAVAGGSNAQITFQWSATDELPLFNHNNNIYVAHYINGAWDDGSLGPVYSSNPYYAVRSAITSFSPFTIVSSNTILPVQLFNFTAKLVNNYVFVKWQTSSESNTSHFNIQRSTDGVQFKNTGIVNAAGNSSVTHTYSFTDPNIIKLNTNTIYYRLQTVDKDNKSSLSKIVPIQINSNNNVLSMWPNPVRNNLNVQVKGYNGSITISIFDIAGKTIIKQKQNVTGNVISINTASLNAGTYFINIEQNGKSLKQKFVKD